MNLPDFSGHHFPKRFVSYSSELYEANTCSKNNSTFHPSTRENNQQYYRPSQVSHTLLRLRSNPSKNLNLLRRRSDSSTSMKSPESKQRNLLAALHDVVTAFHHYVPTQ